MELYIFRHETWQKLYACDYLTDEQWDSHRVPHVYHGTFSICFSLLATCLYIPCLIAMRKKEFFSNTCYKIMFYLGVVDLWSQIIDGYVSGFLLIVGAEFCTFPHFIYIAGTFSFSSWCSQSVLCLLLAVNRLCDISNNRKLDVIFTGYRTHMWCCLALIYGLVMTFTPTSLVFVSSAGGSWFYDPYVGYNNLTLHAGIDRSWYFNYMMGVQNIGTTVLLFILYAIMITKLYLKTKATEQRTSKYQLSIFYQAALICSITAVAALTYLCMQFFCTPEWLVAVGHLTWQGSNGGPAFIYLIFNRSIRRKVVQMFAIRKRNEITSTTRNGF